MPAVTEHKEGEHPLGDAGQLIGLAVFLVVWGLDSFFLHWTTFLSAHVPLLVRLAAMVAVIAVAVVLVRGGHAAVPDHREGPMTVITTGAFAWVRHPLYLGSVLFFFALAFSTLSLAAAAVALALFAWYDRLADFEEKYLESKLGEEYAGYKARTRRWLPAPPGR